MAKAVYGNIITNLKGSIAHNTYQQGRYGAIVRKKGKAINRNTAAQATVRAFFSTLTKAWKSLTDNQRAGWRGASVSFPKKDSLAQTIFLTGAQLYISANRYLQAIGQSTISAFPGISTQTPVLTWSVDPDVSDASQVATYTPAIPATASWILQATRPLSAGKFSSSQDYKQIGVYNTADASPLDFTAAYEAVFGTGWKVAGQKIFYRIIPVVKLSGQPATTFRTSATVVA